ncbi:hypothetical protein [Clavibacter michiganensis]|uniref:hypothetical protein n=1 Tax=Clavibacter michiganensis TaxID=28447 RepID=UPI000FFC2A07|nr:hypothetical protein [Clavibacter michiganensis]MBF4638492.1 hypothetical protein [Clavibacter michiganensis subsp. michiganensis]MDO4030474.1 hypothetical protein [Clavibacter michiganensis]MDO4033352.1 hypothetical protein [Clavibacter michiganensis]MDO4073589.1 hypothetical protein [Clavibacter michiganensis]MDO4082756.1 hypothetical protein [Clavibacter michiganensis]
MARDAGADLVHLEARYWWIQVEDRPVLGYVMRHPAELGTRSRSRPTPTPATSSGSGSGLGVRSR